MGEEDEDQVVSCRGCGAAEPAPGWLSLTVTQATALGEWVPESPVDPLGGFYCSLPCVANESLRLVRARSQGLVAGVGPRGDFTARDLPS